MRINRLIILFLLVACKASTPPSLVTYSEDLSVYRHEMQESAFKEKEPTKQKVKQEFYKPLTRHLQQELDSVIRIAQEQNKAGKYVDGYVIQVYSGNSRAEANQIKSGMREFFPELNPKISYRQPNFRIKAGRFKDKLKANRIHQQVKEKFPKAILLPERFFLKYE